MSAIEKCIREAVEKGGYLFDNLVIPAGLKPTFGAKIAFKFDDILTTSKMMWPQILLDPLFWQALGKARGWGKCKVDGQEPNHLYCVGYPEKCDYDKENDLFHWHRFIDHLASEGTAEDFFADLIK